MAPATGQEPVPAGCQTEGQIVLGRDLGELRSRKVNIKMILSPRLMKTVTMGIKTLRSKERLAETSAPIQGDFFFFLI